MKRLNAAINSRYSIYNPESIPKIINWWLNETSMADFDIVFPMPTEKDWERIRKREAKMIDQFALFNNPVLVIHGKESYMNYLHPEQNASIFPNSEMILLEKCGHVVFIDAKEEYFKSINDFLNKESK